MVVKIKGVIGLDITAAMVEGQLNREGGDLTVELDSPGGLVSESVSIFNAIAKYDKGTKTIDVRGEAASGASYIMFSGDKVKLAHNSSVFIHPPQGCTWGDYRNMYSYGSYLEDLTKMFISEYSRYMGISEDEAKSIVEAGQWFIGKEKLSQLGEVYDAKDAQNLDENSLKHQAEESMVRMQARMTRDVLEKDFKQCAQMFSPARAPEMTPNMSNINNKVDTVIKTEVVMDKTELKEKHPDLYQSVMKEGYDKGYNEGKEAELKRVKAHMRMIPYAADVAKKAIEDGSSFMSEEIQAQYMEAKFKSKMMADMEDDNPPEVNPGEPVNTQANGGKTTEQQKKDAEMQAKKDLKAALASFGKELPDEQK